MTDTTTLPIREPSEFVDAVELQAIKHLLALLDKTFKTTRTYGPHNPVAQKFFQQFYDFLTIQLATHDTLQFLAHHAELIYKGVVVYQSTAANENLAFKLHTDGIRELSFLKGVSQDDLTYFLEALWGTYDPEKSDDDIVTRLWERNLSTISFVTAEEIVKSADAANLLTPQRSQSLSGPPSELRHVAATEAARAKVEAGSLIGAQSQGSPVGFECSPDEHKTLAQEIETESARDNTTYLLDLLTAILASETSDALLTRLLALFGDILGTLTREGNWKLLNTFVSLLHEAQEVCPNLSDHHKKKLVELAGSLGHSDIINTIKGVLNESPATSLDDLQAVLLLLNPQTAQPLCGLMANLKHKSHRMMVCDVLTVHGKQNPSLLVRGMSDTRWYVVRNLVYIMGKLKHEQFVRHLEPAGKHADIRVRKEVVRTLRAIRPGGTCECFIPFLNDSEESIRLLTLKTLLTGHYAATFSSWAPIVDDPSFHHRSVSEKQTIFRVMRQTAGEENIPYWHSLVTHIAWRNRRKYREGGILAAEALGALGTPAALLVLKAGQRRFNRPVRKACGAALAAAMKRSPSGSQPM
jgi:hypothetical protein